MAVPGAFPFESTSQKAVTVPPTIRTLPDSPGTPADGTDGNPPEPDGLEKDDTGITVEELPSFAETVTAKSPGFPDFSGERLSDAFPDFFPNPPPLTPRPFPDFLYHIPEHFKL